MRFRRRRVEEKRHARVDVDRRGRLIVMSTRGSTAAPPVTVVEAAAADAELGAAVHAALEAASPYEAAPVPDVDPDLDRLGITWGELDSAPGLGIEASSTQVRLYGWTPSPRHGGRVGAGIDDIVLAEPPESELGAGVRELLRALGSGLPVPAQAGEPFGFKTSWLAIRGVGADAVADAIGLAEREPAPWREGVRRTAEADAVFVTPEAGGWTFVVGVPWLEDLDPVAGLSERLGTDVQYFASHRVPEAHLWARAEDGRLTRAAGYVGERGEAFGEGEPTEVERRLRVDWTLPRWSESPELDEYPDEETVAEIADAWSIDPSTLARVASSPGPGLIGRLTEPLG